METSNNNDRTATMYQLIAKSKMDLNIQSNGVGEMDHFKTGYEQTYVFEIDNQEYYHNTTNDVKFGQLVKYNINKAFDFIGEVVLKVELPQLPKGSYYVNSIGHRIINYIQIKHESNVVYSITGELLYLKSKMDETKSKSQGFDKMIGTHRTKQSLLENSLVDNVYYVYIPFWKSKTNKNYFPMLHTNNTNLQIHIKFNDMKRIIEGSLNNQLTFKSSIYIDAVYISRIEKYIFMTTPLEYIMEQYTYDEFIIDTDVHLQFDLNFKHLIKELYIVALDLYDIHENNYQKIEDIEIYINGRKRDEFFNHKNSNKYMIFNNHKNIPREYIYNYSFGLLPTELQPSGHCNFNATKNNFIKLRMLSGQKRIRVYAINYNFYDINPKGYGKLRFF